MNRLDLELHSVSLNSFQIGIRVANGAHDRSAANAERYNDFSIPYFSTQKIIEEFICICLAIASGVAMNGLSGFSEW